MSGEIQEGFRKPNNVFTEFLRCAQGLGDPTPTIGLRTQSHGGTLSLPKRKPSECLGATGKAPKRLPITCSILFDLYNILTHSVMPIAVHAKIEKDSVLTGFRKCFVTADTLV